MTKIVVLLRSVFIMSDQFRAYCNPEIREIKLYPTLRFNLLKSLHVCT